MSYKCVSIDMDKMLKIWIPLCLFGLLGSVISGINQPISPVNIIEYDSADSNSITGSVLFSTPHPYLFLAENVQEIFKEVEPRSSATNPGWFTLQKEFSTSVFYIQRSLSFSLSQTVRDMIFPFHSYL